MYQIVSGLIYGPYEIPDGTLSTLQPLMRVEYEIALKAPPEDFEEGIEAILVDAFPYLETPDGESPDIPEGVFRHVEISQPPRLTGYTFGPATATFSAGPGFEYDNIEGWLLYMPDIPGGSCRYVVLNGRFVAPDEEAFNWTPVLIGSAVLLVGVGVMLLRRPPRSVVRRLLRLIARGERAESPYNRLQKQFFRRQARLNGWKPLNRSKTRFRLPSGNEIRIDSAIRSGADKLMHNPITRKKSGRPDMVFVNHHTNEVIRWEAWSSESRVSRWEHEAKDLGYDLGHAFDPSLKGYKFRHYLYDTAKRKLLINGEVIPRAALDDALSTLVELGVKLN